MKRLLSTKILPEPLRDKLTDAGWELTQYNAISVELLPVLFEPEDSIAVFTSKHAVHACLSGSADKGLTGAVCLCVGNTTASLVREHGGVVMESASSATELASLIAEKYTKKFFIYYCGDRRLDILPEAFDKLQIDWEEVIAYRTKIVERSFNMSFDGIMFFSPSGVEGFTRSNVIGLATAFCIGPTTALAVSNHTKRFKIAESPGMEALVSLVIQQTNPVKN